MLYPIAVKVILYAAVSLFLRVVWHMDWNERIQPAVALEHTSKIYRHTHTHACTHTTCTLKTHRHRIRRNVYQVRNMPFGYNTHAAESLVNKDKYGGKKEKKMFTKTARKRNEEVFNPQSNMLTTC